MNEPEQRGSEHAGASGIACEECRRVWTDPRERWQVYLSEDEPSVPVSYCPGCAEREFGEGRGAGA